MLIPSLGARAGGASLRNAQDRTLLWFPPGLGFYVQYRQLCMWFRKYNSLHTRANPKFLCGSHVYARTKSWKMHSWPSLLSYFLSLNISRCSPQSEPPPVGLCKLDGKEKNKQRYSWPWLTSALTMILRKLAVWKYLLTLPIFISVLAPCPRKWGYSRIVTVTSQISML